MDGRKWNKITLSFGWIIFKLRMRLVIPVLLSLTRIPMVCLILLGDLTPWKEIIFMQRLQVKNFKENAQLIVSDFIFKLNIN